MQKMKKSCFTGHNPELNFFKVILALLTLAVQGKGAKNAKLDKFRANAIDKKLRSDIIKYRLKKPEFNSNSLFQLCLSFYIKQAINYENSN